MKIEKFKKIGKNKYKIFFDNDEIDLFEDVILKYNLLVVKEINIDLLNKIIEENTFYEVYNNALNYIDIKMRNTLELKGYLKRKSYDWGIIDSVILKLKEEGYLDDKKYAKAFINDKINLSLFGPFKIKNELLKFNIDEQIIDDYLNTIENDIWLEKINKIIEKKIKLNKKLSGNYLKQKLSEDLYYLGYDKETFIDLIDYIKIDESDSVKKEYDKVYKKYKNKYNGEMLEKMLKNYLIKKGFNYESINEVIKNKN